MLETTFAVLAAAQAGMTCYGILLITGGGEMPERTREFWRVTTHAGENGDQVYDGLMWEYDTEHEAIRIAKSVVVAKKQEFATVQHIRETILSEEKIGGKDEASV